MAEEIDAVAKLLEQAVRKVGELKKETDSAMHKLGELCERKECVMFKRDVLEVGIQRVVREWDKYAKAVSRVQSGVETCKSF